MEYKVGWTRSARVQLKELCNYIKQDSLTNSEKVRKKFWVLLNLYQRTQKSIRLINTK